MELKQVKEVFLSLKGSFEDFPFGPEVAVYKVGGKMFGLMNENQTSINLKNDPLENEMLRLEFEGITPGYHMNKKHWNTIDLDSVDDEIIESLIRQSYKMVYMKLPQKVKKEIDGYEGN